MYMGKMETRRIRRNRVLMKAMIIASGRSFEATVKDFSSAGAQLSSAEAPPVDSDVIFKRGEIFAAARVAWSDGQTYGIEFYRKIEPAQLSR